MLDYVFPANGVDILKPTIATADNRHQFIWGDTVHVGPGGARRMGQAPPEQRVRSAKLVVYGSPHWRSMPEILLKFELMKHLDIPGGLAAARADGNKLS
jgi:hypothetical protein